MDKSIDTLRAEMWRDRYSAIFNQYHSLVERERLMREEYNAMAQDLDDFYKERCDLKEALLREKEDNIKHSHEAIELRLRCEKLQEKIDKYEESDANLEKENARLRWCLRDLVDAGTQYLAFSQSIDGSDGSREAQFREVIETGRKETEKCEKL